MGSQPKTIAIDFDGVIHAYSKGWQDGTCYDKPVSSAFEAIKALMDSGYSVFILSTRKPKQIKTWLRQQIFEVGGFEETHPIYGFTIEIIPFWKRFWNKKYVLGITRRKIVATVYLDDRGLKFTGDWHKSVQDIIIFKTYQQ